ncbi:peptidoglycan-binding protein [Sedimentibacter sp. zth1]|uniref:peptidoglycan-binding domain-containing protein n=1 Tax=Sedimentibacter sp. zth1 TaxID=2816908 RepID=UPI001F5FBA4E|nr:peptidoglycan-binding domain-containing protein [Sedimentibacter sp. zth1]
MSTKVLVYNDDKENMELYYLQEKDTMPYVTNGTLTVGEFRGSSDSPTIWTNRSVMECWNTLRERWGKPIGVKFAFKRIWEGGHGSQSQHYAGTAMDMAQTFTNEERDQLRILAEELGCWEYVEPAELTPVWVHVDKRLTPPACEAGYIKLALGSVNTNVLVLQDALNTLGFIGAGLDGIFGPGTKNAVKEYQESRDLDPDGVVGCETWQNITKEVKGTGMTDTTIL